MKQLLITFVLRSLCTLLFWPAAGLPAFSQEQQLPGSRPLSVQGDLSAQMVTGIHKFLLEQTRASVTNRARFWKRDTSSAAGYVASVQINREHLQKIIGATDRRVTNKELEYISRTGQPAKLAEAADYTVFAVRWPVFECVYGEGLWLVPKESPKAHVVAIPDADQTPEMVAGLTPDLPAARQFARRLAEHGCSVLIPALINRGCSFSGSERLKRFTNQPHREWIYRQAYMIGRHVIGYEVQKVMAAVDFFAAQNATPTANIGVVGYGEGGLIAFYSAAVDTRIGSALVSGYFDARENLWQEPIYRNVFGLLEQFGDAEIATLIAPRALVVEHSVPQTVTGPPKPGPGRAGAAPGRIDTPDFVSVEREFNRARGLLNEKDILCGSFRLISGTEGMTTGPGADRALEAFLNTMGLMRTVNQPVGMAPASAVGPDPEDRQRRQIRELENYTQKLFWESEKTREEFVLGKAKFGDSDHWNATCQELRRHFREEVIGQFPPPAIPLNLRSRALAVTAREPIWRGYEVMLDVYPDVFAWGYLLVPRDIAAGERRPMVVCQHGLEGVPADLMNEDTASKAYGYYKAFAVRLCERGFVVFVPHNPYRGGDRFRELQRQANPLKKSLFSIITAQHERILEWLGTLPFVDPKRIGFYGLSYGGKTAMRVPAALPGYALSICSGDFNEWVRKNLSLDYEASYMFTGEYEMPEFDLGHTFNYAEMAALIAPRPFMVERGHSDGVGKDEWVTYEYAKVRRLYDSLGIGERTAIEFFNEGHTIHGQGTFEFLHRHLNWPQPVPRRQ
jgi:dienelactone hydrolase